MPSVNSRSIPKVCDSSTLTTPSLPTLSMASAMTLPTSSERAEMAPTLEISSLPLISLDWPLMASTAASTACSMPLLKMTGFAPAATFFKPSRTIVCARTVAVVVPSPAMSLVLVATSLTPAHGMPSFRQLLAAVTDAWRTRREELEAAGSRIAEGISARLDLGTPTPLTAEVLDRAVAALARGYDERCGGFGGAPKFPPSMVLEFLLRHSARTGDDRALRMARGTLEAMGRGGIHDQLAGGFARYSVDAQWVGPHFEKMLYDNALLLQIGRAHV